MRHEKIIASLHEHLLGSNTFQMTTEERESLILTDSVAILRLAFRRLKRESGSTNSDRFDELLESVSGAGWCDDLPSRIPHPDFVSSFPISLAREWHVIALQPENDNGPVPVAIADIESLSRIDMVGRFLQLPVEAVFASETEIDSLINLAFQNRGSQTETAIQTLRQDDNILRISKSDRQDLLDQHGNPPVIRLVNSILFDAVMDRASDIHIQPFESRLQIRFRIDGVLFDQFEIPKESQEEVISRIKIIGRMNIAEKRLAQDGRATADIGDRRIDLRIASVPASYGERIVIRLLDKSARLYTLDQLGMHADDLTEFQKLIRMEHGLILVTGPTGGGKSTTLYAALKEINSNSCNVVTLEDPIEYQLDGISQIPITEKKGMTFASGLRSVLRQDPDIIMVGEIRDEETADMAIKSALTGHMVFSTLHTNDAPTAVTRLLDLDIEPFLVSSSLVGVLSQRLVRRICEDCSIEDNSVTDPDLARLGVTDRETFSAKKGIGCDNCRGTGYRGRVGVFELMAITELLRELIQQRANAAEIRTAAVAGGMRLLAEDGTSKIRRGLTTVAEVSRISTQVDY